MFNSPYAYPNPYLQNMQSVNPAQPQQVVKVNGRNGAEMFQMGANSSVLLLDESAPIVWLATTDGAGYKSLAAYDIKPHEEIPVPDMRTLEQRITRIEERLSHGNESYTAGDNREVNDRERARAGAADSQPDKVLR